MVRSLLAMLARTLFGLLALTGALRALADEQERADAYAWWKGQCYSADCGQPPGAQFAILDFRQGAYVIRIDGATLPDKARELRWMALAPGKYRVSYGGVFAYSRGYSIPSVDRVYMEQFQEIDFRAGHVYETQRERVYHERRDYLWIEDLTTGEIVAGAPPADRQQLRLRSNEVRAARLAREGFENAFARADCGDPRAQSEVALYYLAGLEPLPAGDLALAYAWYTRAAQGGDAAAPALAERIRPDLSAVQLERARTFAAQAAPGDCPPR
jgi:TPR repeat protein